MSKVACWFHWLLYWFGWTKQHFEFHSKQLASHSFLSSNSEGFLKIRNAQKLAEYQVRISRCDDASFSKLLSTTEELFEQKGIETRILNWKIPSNLSTSLYQMECSSQEKVIWRSEPFLVVDYEFKWLNEELLELGQEKEWPYLAEVQCQISFPNKIQFTNNLSSRIRRTNEPLIEVRTSHSCFKFLNRFNVLSRVSVHPAKQLIQIGLWYHPKEGIFSGAQFVWEFWLNFGGNYRCCLFKSGPYTPVTTIDTMANSSLVKMLTGYNEDSVEVKTK